MNGFNIIEDKFLSPLTEHIQFRFPKSKKKRIRNKWFKDKKNFKIKETERFIRVGNDIIVSSKTYEMLKNIN